jgi:hypothetical protein
MDRHEAIEQDVLGLVREIAARFEHAKVTGPDPDPPAGARIELSCTWPGTASVLVYPSGDDINVYLGPIWIELSHRSMERARAIWRRRLTEVLEAIVGGGYVETTWRVGDRIVHSKAALYRPGSHRRLAASRWHGLWALAPSPWRRKAVVRFAPYS